jgi:pyruvate formate lyase activating enzyme
MVNFRAKWWKSLKGNQVKCYLCPRVCLLKSGQTGFCGVRKNVDGALYSLVYGLPVAVHVDPIEKKPLYHFLPGSKAFSVGTIGCSLNCKFCQNWEISRGHVKFENFHSMSPEKIVQTAVQSGCQSIAYTYNEPTIFGEYVIDIARQAREQGLKNIMVTNGYITAEAIQDIYPYIDAANIDLKAFSDQFYRRYCGAKLEPVLKAIELIHAMKVHIELTTLIISGLNDNVTELRALCDWIIDTLGQDIPVHFSAFHPAYQMLNHLPTSKAELDRAVEIALSAKINYVYEGNVQRIILIARTVGDF